jgi:hypothetical protein
MFKDELIHQNCNTHKVKKQKVARRKTNEDIQLFLVDKRSYRYSCFGRRPCNHYRLTAQHSF